MTSVAYDTQTPLPQGESLSLELPPTAEVPSGRPSGPERPAMLRPCTCGVLVLHGQTDTGEPLALDVHETCYTVLWLNDTPVPRLALSRAYPVHRCGGVP